MVQRTWIGRLAVALVLVSLSTGLGSAATGRAVAAGAYRLDRDSSAQTGLAQPMLPSRLAPAPAVTLTFTVNSTADAPDAKPGDGICADASGQCTLRAAIQEADAQPSGSSITINVPAGTYGLTLGTLLLTANNITISGALSSTTIISGNNTSTIMGISPTVQASISQVTITGGKQTVPPFAAGGIHNTGRTVLNQIAILSNTASQGGGIANAKGAWLSVAGSTINGNTAKHGDGGGIANFGTLSVTSSTVSNNTSLEYGGGIANGAGRLTVTASTVMSNTGGVGGGIASTNGTLHVTASTISDNTAFATGDYGGGIYISYGGTASVSNSTVSGNAASGEYGAGGGIYSTETLTVTNSTISDNVGGDYYGGGGIYNSGTLSVSNSTFSGNAAGIPVLGTGGGILNGGLTTVATSSFSNNMAYTGGGIYNQGGSSTLTVTASTFSNNAATSYGGGIENIGIGSVTNSTFNGNTASPGGGITNGCVGYFCGAGTLALSFDTIAANSDGIANVTGTVTLMGTMVANSTSGANCSGGRFRDHGYNLDSGTSCGFSRTTDITDTNPLLGPLANNGGPTQTMALLPGSPAIDHGGTHATGCPSTDQRGKPRPDEAADSGACDMGAYESQGIG